MAAPLPATRRSATDRWCATRALKNAHSLSRLLPQEFPPPGPGEAYLSCLPLEELVRLHHLTPAELDGVDPRLSRLRGPIPGPGTVRGSLFSGTLRMLHVMYDLGSGSPLSLNPPDVATALHYTATAAGPIQRYAAQYGPNQVAVDPTILPVRFPVGSPRFTDQALQTWLNGLVQSGTLRAGDCPIILAPPGVLNADAPADQGVLGYHGHASLPYIFVNVLGSGFAPNDPGDLFALALSHEVAEMVVDPAADGSNPEVCDPCGPNCQSPLRDYFAQDGRYLGTTTAFPPAYSYGFYLNAIVQPSAAAACPAPVRACAYGPP